MAARRSPFAVLVHVLALLAMCVVGPIGPTRSSHRTARPAVTARTRSAVRSATLRTDTAGAEARRAGSMRSGVTGGGPDVFAEPPSPLLPIAPPAIRRIAATRPAPQRIAPPDGREPTARGPPPLA